MVYESTPATFLGVSIVAVVVCICSVKVLAGVEVLFSWGNTGCGAVAWGDESHPGCGPWGIEGGVFLHLAQFSVKYSRINKQNNP